MDILTKLQLWNNLLVEVKIHNVEKVDPRWIAGIKLASFERNFFDKDELVAPRLGYLLQTVYEMTNLKKLVCHGLRPETISTDFKNLVNLEELVIHGITYTSIPEIFLELPNLKKLSINHSMDVIPHEFSRFFEI